MAKAKRLRAGLRGALAALEAQGDPAWQAADKWGRRWASHRRAELARAHGGEISAGVGVVVEMGGGLIADAYYWRARGRAEGNAELSKLAASLIAQARGCERDAWELASRESDARKRADKPSVSPVIDAIRAELAKSKEPTHE